MQREHRPLGVVAVDVEGDLDRRCDDEPRVCTVVAQRGESAGGNPGMALHPGPDQADLRHVVDPPPDRPQLIDCGLRLLAVGERRREDDLVARLDDRVDVDAGFGERLE